VYDISFYCSIFLMKTNVSLENSSLFDTHYKITKNKKEPYYYGQIYPEEIILKFRTKHK